MKIACYESAGVYRCTSGCYDSARGIELCDYCEVINRVNLLNHRQPCKYALCLPYSNFTVVCCCPSLKMDLKLEEL